MQKHYTIDTNVLLDNPNAISVLRNGQENKVSIPLHVIYELDQLKKDKQVGVIAKKAIDKIIENSDEIEIINVPSSISEKTQNIDYRILSEFNEHDQESIFVTNDKILSLICNNVFDRQTQDFKDSNPYKSEAEVYTGFVVSEEELVSNSFIWKEGKPFFYNGKKLDIVDFEHDIWKVKPKNVYQNLMFHLCSQQHIDLLTIQSQAGLGKTFLSLAVAFNETLQHKKYNKIMMIKSSNEIGDTMGFLPGDIMSKIDPYFKYLNDIVLKLHDLRKANRIFLDPENPEESEYNPKKFELSPVQYLRGRTIENTFVIIDEIQNMSRHEVRSILTRMGENTKVICTGDVKQIDNPHLTEFNNGMTWITKKCKGYINYGHLILKGKKSRGPVCDLILNSQL